MTTAQGARDWALFMDWCLSQPEEPAAITLGVLDEFFEQVPVKDATRRNRTRHILDALAAVGVPLERPVSGNATTIRSGPGFVSIAEALAQLPTLRFPVGLRGRRDGWLLVLIGVLNMSREEARSVEERHVQLYPRFEIAGKAVPRATDAMECPACAVYRWLRVVGLTSAGDRGAARETLNAYGADLAEHDCQSGLDGSWRLTSTLLPAIDQHGWVRSSPLTPESISHIMVMRQAQTGFKEQRSVLAEARGRFKDATDAELVDAQDDVFARAEALLARSAELLGDADFMMSRLDELL